MYPDGVLVVIAKREFAEKFTSFIYSNGFGHSRVASSSAEARRIFEISEPDITIIAGNLPDEDGITLAMDLSNLGNAGIILTVSRQIYDDTVYKMKGTGVTVLAKPLERATLLQTLNLVSATRQNAKEVERLKKSMKNRRIVEQAKWLLVQNEGLTEPIAHRQIQKQSMDLRVAQRDVALLILKKYGISEDVGE
jgi:AmiR/NasT family two-component response regulator